MALRAQLVVIVTNCLHAAAVTDLAVQTEIAACSEATSTFHISSSFFDAMISLPSCYTDPLYLYAWRRGVKGGGGEYSTASAIIEDAER